MAELLLHHYETSPFCEKMRRILAYKRLPYAAVRVPAVMPKPDLVALTGGYRKVPLLQIDNHIYCDTQLMAKVVEQLAPEPTLYPDAATELVAEWADTVLFDVVVPIGMRPTRFDEILKLMTPDELNKLADDRKGMREGARRMPLPGKTAKALLPVYLSRLEAALRKHEHVCGTAASIADFAVYHNVWFLKMLTPEVLSGHPALEGWMARIAALPDPAITARTADDAIARSRAGSPDWQPNDVFADPIGFAHGARVTVRPLDYGRDPVNGALVSSTQDEIVVRREDERAGVVFVHFPRVGYEVTAEGAPLR